jgi:ABC-type nitrate/sulfonate/bicarbonate transport system substrate-binding protein
VKNLEKTSITVDDFPSVDSAGLYIAQLEGFFADEGLNVKINEVFSGSQQRVVDDMVQFGFVPASDASFLVSSMVG